MFDLDLEKILVIIIVAVVVIGPKDLPRALRAAGRWIGKARRVSNHFRAGVENMIREAELEEMEKKWAAQNAAIMGAHPALGCRRMRRAVMKTRKLAQAAPRRNHWLQRLNRRQPSPARLRIPHPFPPCALSNPSPLWPLTSRISTRRRCPC